MIGRLGAGVVVLVGLLFAYSLESVVTGLEIFWKVSAMMGIAFWGGLLWRRTTSAGAWAGTLVAFFVFLFTSDIELLGQVIWNFNSNFASKLPEYLLVEGKLSLPWQMIFYLVCGLTAMIVVSLLTPRVSDEKLKRFYACLRTPVEAGEPATKPFELPPSVKPAPRRVIFDYFELEIPRLSRIELVGVVGTIAAVALLLVAARVIFSLGT